MHILRVPQPFKNESINGYIQRVAYDNHYEDANWIYRLANCSKSLKKNPLISLELLSLSKLLNIDVKKLLKLTFINEFHFNKDIRNEERKHKYPYSHGINLYSKYCPICFKNNNYHNKLWDLTYNIACYEHNVRLIDVCPKCNNGISSKLVNMYTCNCGFHLYNLPVISHPSKYSFIGEIIEKIFNRDKSFDNKLIDLNPRDLSQLVLFLVNIINKEKNKNLLRLAGDLNKNENYFETVFTAFDMFNNWPTNFHSFLNTYGNTVKRKGRKVGINTYFNSLYLGLYKDFKKREFNFIRDEFEDYITNNFKKVHITKLKNFKKQSSPVYISGQHASIILNVNHKEISKLLKQEKLKGYIETHAKQEFINVDYKSVIHLKKLKDDFISLPEAVKVLGINRLNIIKMYECNIVRGIVEPTSRGRNILFEKKSLEKLLSRIDRLVSVKSELVQKSVSFAHAIHSWGCKQIELAILFQCIFNKKILPIHINEDRIGLDRFLFYKPDLDKAADTYLKTITNKDHYNCKEVCEELKVDSHILKLWVDKGFLKVNKISSKVIHIYQTDIDNFNDNYISLTSLSKTLKSNSKKIKNTLREKGIYSLTEPVKNSGGHLFWKKDIEKWLSSFNA